MDTIELKGKENKDCKIMTTNVENEALGLIYALLDSKAFKDVPIRIMPDTHMGKGIVIGFTAPIGNMISPSHVGVDIGCEVSFYRFNKKVNTTEFALIEHRVRKEIPFGFDINDKREFDMKDFIKFMSNGFNKIRSQWSEMIDDLVDISEEGFDDMCNRIGMDIGTFYKSLGSVGGGNHYIEFGSDAEGNYTCSVHCGSRNFGTKVCKYWENRAKMQPYDKDEYKLRVQEIKKNTKNRNDIPKLIDAMKEELIANSAPNGYLMGDNMRGYITDMAIAQLYAAYNHIVIMRKIEKIMQNINGGKIVETIHTTHNYIDYSDHVIRKGAIRSYVGEKMVIPFNMRDGIAICEGKSNADWNNSAPHGCGRLMPRAEARNKLSLDEFKEQMNGIYSTSVDMSTIDEAPNAYKPMDEIVEAIQPTCTILEFVKPIINLKSTTIVND